MGYVKPEYKIPVLIDDFFRKDKSGEKLAESEEDLLEHRTDGSDAFDTLYIGCKKLPVHDIVSVPVSGVM